MADGVYEARIVPGQTGIHYLFLSIPSQKVKPNDLPFRGILVEGHRTQPVQAAGPS